MATPIVSLIASPVVDSTGAVVAGGELEFVDISDPNTRVNVWQDADATLAWTQPITLDGGGRAGGNVYIKDPCRLLIADAEGALVWDVLRPGGVTDRNVEVISDAFTGSIGTATTAGERTYLKTILDRAETSFGGTDWQHLDSASGTERPYVEVVREFGISVKSYGALGNGSADDTVAITATVAKLRANGGGMMTFPPGTYNVSDAFAINFAGLTIQGYGGASIKTTVSNKNIFTCTEDDLQIFDLGLFVADSVGGHSTAYAISMTGCASSVIRNVRTSGTYQFARAISANSSTNLFISECSLLSRDDTVYLDTMTNVFVVSNLIHGTDTASGSGTGLYSASGTGLVIVGNHLRTSGSGTPYHTEIASGTAIAFSDNRLIGGNLGVANGVTYFKAGYGNVDAESSGIVLGSTSYTNDLAGMYRTTFSTSATIASAATIAPVRGLPLVSITGTAAITTITMTPFQAGDIITLLFTDAADITDNTGNIDLNGGASWVDIVAGDRLTLQSDGTRWFEIGRCNT